jgi:hypothetical protein
MQLFAPRRTTLALVPAIVGLAPLLFAAQPLDLAAIEDVRVGFGGTFKVGQWTPVSVTLRARSAPAREHLSLELLDGDGQPSRICWNSQTPWTVPAGAQRTVQTFAKFGRASGDLTVEFRADSGPPVRRTIRVPDELTAVLASQQLLLHVGTPFDMEDAIRRRLQRASESIVYAKPDRIAELPTHWIGYAGVDGLVMSTSDLQPYGELSADQITAIAQWIHLGGRLLLCVGVHGPELLDGEGKLGRFAPGTFSQVVRVRRMPQLESLGGVPLPAGGPAGPNAGLAMTVLTDLGGAVLADEGDRRNPRPSLVHQAVGLGRVVFCAVDLDAEPFVSWAGRDRLNAHLLELLLDPSGPVEMVAPHDKMAHVGYEDLSGQLRVALDQFPGVLLVPFWLVALLAVAYIALIGPADYFLLRKLRRGMTWTWLTFPAAVILLPVLAWRLAAYWKGDELRINQVDLVDVDMRSGWVRGTTWAHLYSPASDLFNLSLEPKWLPDRNVAGSGALLSWHGLPGVGFGGMDRRSIPISLADVYTMAGSAGPEDCMLLSMDQFPISIGSSRSVIGQWWSQCETFTSTSDGLSAPQGGQLTGQVRNPLPFSLEDCLLAFGDWAYSIERLEARGSVAVDELTLRGLEYLLTRRKVDVKQMENITTPWDPEDVDVPRILQMMMFHQAAGGRAYTGWLDRFQGYVDLSGHLTLGRAILVGRASQAGAHLKRDGQTLTDGREQHWTFYRIVYPVANQPTANGGR